MVRHQDGQDGGPDHSEVPGEQQEPPAAALWSARQLILLRPQDTLVHGERSERAQSYTRASVYVWHPRHLVGLGKKLLQL